MAYTIGSLPARASSAGNPITVSVTPAAGETVMVLMLKTVGAVDRAGGAPTWVNPLTNATVTLVQANSTQKAAASPECGAELWYMLNFPTGQAGTLTIPNTNAATIFHQRAFGKARAGGGSYFIAAWGGNATSTNPTAGSGNIPESDCIVFATTAGGWQTFAPSARTGTSIYETDDGADGGGGQYLISPAIGSQAMSWTFGTSDDWGAVAAAFGERLPLSANNYLAARGSGMNYSERIR